MAESKNIKKFKQVCQCKNCGNEAEMEITCTLEPEDVEKAGEKSGTPHKHKGHAVCTKCGNEADMWVDLP